MRTLMDKINHFESLPAQTVEEFNKIFTRTELSGLDKTLHVTIGELADTDTTRFLTVGKLVVKHNFTPVPELVEIPQDGAGTHAKDSIPEYRENRQGKRR